MRCGQWWILAWVWALWLATGVAAQDVTLDPLNGDLRIEGTLLGFDGDFYRVQSQYGEITVDATAVECSGPGCPSLTTFMADVAIAGSATIGEVLMPALLQSYARREGLRIRRDTLAADRFDIYLHDPQRNRDVAVFRFLVDDTDLGFDALLANRADIVMALRPIRPHETEVLAEAGLGALDGPNRARVLALDALVPMVALQSHVEAISLADLGAILAGEVVNWAELGGPDLPIAVHLRNPGSGLAQGAMDRILAPLGKALGAEVTRHASDAALDAAVSEDPGAIGLGSHARLRNARVPVLQGSCGFAQTAHRTSIKSEDYPLAAPLLLYIPARRLPARARDFLAFTRSPGAQIVIRRAGFIDQTPEELPLALQGDRLANAIAVSDSVAPLQALRNALAPRLRLTTSFRFSEGGQRLDPVSLSNIQQLARSLEHGDFDGRDLLIAGFSAGDSPDGVNRQASLAQARLVKEALEAALQMPSPTLEAATLAGFGAQMPLACEATPIGERVNRRVEIWLH